MTENTQERQFSIQRIYTKDISFETPNTPEIFMQEWKPQVNVNLNNAVKDLGEGNLEVALTVTVTAKIEAAAKSGIEKVIIPRANLQDVLMDEKWEQMVEVLPVDSLDEVLEYSLVGAEEKVSLVERLAKVIDTISKGTDTQPSA